MPAAKTDERRGTVVGALACQKNSYLRTLESEVLSCVANTAKPANGNKRNGSTTPLEQWLIEFEDSVLFPEGGGQPSDHGTLTPTGSSAGESIPIRLVQRQGLRCVYHSPRPLDPGTRVRQDVDWTRRWDHMQQHTGQHLLSAIMDTYPDLETLGWGLGSEISYVDLPRRPSVEEVQNIQSKCNEYIRENCNVTVETPENEQGETLPGDYDKQDGVIRVINIEGVDRNPCCGTHLRQTSHMSLILLGPSQTVTSKCRLSFAVGERALKLATSSVQSLRSLAPLVSSGGDPADVETRVRGVIDNAKESRRKETRLLTEIAQYEADRAVASLAAGKNVFLHRPEPGMDFINTVSGRLKEALKDGGVAILASGEKANGGQVVILSEDKALLDDTAEKVKEAVPGIKGGGKGRWQGKTTEWKKGELDALRRVSEG